MKIEELQKLIVRHGEWKLSGFFIDKFTHISGLIIKSNDKNSVTVIKNGKKTKLPYWDGYCEISVILGRLKEYLLYDKERKNFREF